MLLCKTGFFQPGAKVLRAVKLGADVGLIAAFAHYLRIGTGTQHQLQGIQHDGFSCPGFSGQYRKASLPVQIEGLNNHKVLQGDALQSHDQEPPSFQPSFLRRVAK